jgi:hypothetical protein
MSITAEQRDWIQDAMAIVHVIKREGIPPLDQEAMQRDLKFLMEKYEDDISNGFGGVIGVLASVVATQVDEEYLDEFVMAALGTETA